MNNIEKCLALELAFGPSAPDPSIACLKVFPKVSVLGQAAHLTLRQGGEQNRTARKRHFVLENQ